MTTPRITDADIDKIMPTTTKIDRRPRPRPPGAVIDGSASSVIHPESDSVSFPACVSGGTESNSLLRLPEEPPPFALVPLGELGPAEQPDWLLPGYIARGAITLLTGLWKAGKSTMLAHLLRDLHHGGGLVDVPTDGAVLIVSEEPPGVWARRRDDLRLDPERVLIVQRPTFARTDAIGWRRLIEGLKDEIAARDVALVVIDTLPSVWPVANENDASESLEALGPLRDLSNAGAAVLIVMHPRKGGGGEATATRGSGALPGFVDVIVELRRHNADDAHDRRRLLTAYGRFEDIPPETVIELTDAGYVIVGDRADVREADNESTIMAMLPDGPPGLDVDDLLAAWPGKRPGKGRLSGWLNFGANHDKWKRAGMGVKGDPYRFRRHDPGDNSILSGETHSPGTKQNPIDDAESSAQGLAPERTSWHDDERNSTEGGRDQWPV